MEFDERNYYRVHFPAKASCFFDNEKKAILGTVKNLCIDGCFIETLHPSMDLEGCKINLSLAGNHSNLEINNIAAKVLRQEENGIAVKFEHHFEWIAFAPILERKFPR